MNWNPQIAATTDEWFEATYAHLSPGQWGEFINEHEWVLKEQYQRIWEEHYFTLSRTH